VNVAPLFVPLSFVKKFVDAPCARAKDLEWDAVRIERRFEAALVVERDVVAGARTEVDRAVAALVPARDCACMHPSEALQQA